MFSCFCLGNSILYTDAEFRIQISFCVLQNDSEAVRKVARFLNKDLPDDVIRDIADKCSFKNLKHATETYKQPWYKQLTSRLSLEEQELIAKTKQQETQFYRKGKS